MSISISDYLNGSTYQNARLSSTEKLSQKDEASETGKTTRSAVSSSFDQVNLGEDGAAVAQTSRVQGSDPSVSQQKPATDTVEISQAGRQAAGAAAQAETDAEDAETCQSGTEDLSEYTDTELKQMYYRGEITRQEYEQETGETLGE